MNVVAVIGSPHKDGPGARLTKAFIKGAEDAGHHVTTYYVNDMNIRGCQGCNACKNRSIDCIVKDDLEPYWKELHNADALVVSAPNYAANVAGHMITYMNRHYCLIDADWKPRIHKGIKVTGIFTQGEGDREKYMAPYKWFMADFENRDMELQDIIVHVRNDGEVTEDSELYRRAYNIGNNL